MGLHNSMTLEGLLDRVSNNPFNYLSKLKLITDNPTLIVKSSIQFECSLHGVQTKNYPSWLRYPYCTTCATMKPLNEVENELKQSSINTNFSIDYNSYKGVSQPLSIICKYCNSSYSLLCKTVLKGLFKCPCIKQYEAVKQLKQLFGDEYDYSKTVYLGSRSRLGVICPKHGYVERDSLRNWLNSKGCPKCCLEQVNTNQTYTFQYFLNKAKEVHQDLYEYYEDSYSGYAGYIKFKCLSCGNISNKRIDSHIKSKSGCKCVLKHNQSKSELDLFDYLKSIIPNQDVLNSYRPCWLNGKEIDIFIPHLNLGIEFNGTSTHHSNTNLSSYFTKRSKSTTYHLEKYELCKQNGVTLLHIFEFENMDDWKCKLRNYILNTSKYIISFSNDFRTYQRGKIQFHFYGLSKIEELK